MVALDMSKAFDTVNIHTLIHKIHQTNIPPTILKFTANYIKGRKAYTTYQDSQSKQQQLKTGVPQGGVLSPTLFNIYMSDIPKPPSGIDLETYVDDITTLSTIRYDTKQFYARFAVRSQHRGRPQLRIFTCSTQTNEVQSRGRSTRCQSIYPKRRR